MLMMLGFGSNFWGILEHHISDLGCFCTSIFTLLGLSKQPNPMTKEGHFDLMFPFLWVFLWGSQISSHSALWLRKSKTTHLHPSFIEERERVSNWCVVLSLGWGSSIGMTKRVTVQWLGVFLLWVLFECKQNLVSRFHFIPFNILLWALKSENTFLIIVVTCHSRIPFFD